MPLPIPRVLAEPPGPPRREAEGGRHLLVGILTPAACAATAGAETWKAIAAYGRAKGGSSRRLPQLLNGTPGPDASGRAFARPDPVALAQRLGRRMAPGPGGRRGRPQRGGGPGLALDFGPGRGDRGARRRRLPEGRRRGHPGGGRPPPAGGEGHPARPAPGGGRDVSPGGLGPRRGHKAQSQGGGGAEQPGVGGGHLPRGEVPRRGQGPALRQEGV